MRYLFSFAMRTKNVKNVPSKFSMKYVLLKMSHEKCRMTYASSLYNFSSSSAFGRIPWTGAAALGTHYKPI